jgi:hypothetical protein
MVYYIKINIDKLEQNTEIHNHSTHKRLELHVQFCRTNVLKKSVVNTEKLNDTINCQTKCGNWGGECNTSRGI